MSGSIELHIAPGGISHEHDVIACPPGGPEVAHPIRLRKVVRAESTVDSYDREEI